MVTTMKTTVLDCGMIVGFSAQRSDDGEYSPETVADIIFDKIGDVDLGPYPVIIKIIIHTKYMNASVENENTYIDPNMNTCTVITFSTGEEILITEKILDESNKYWIVKNPADGVCVIINDEVSGNTGRITVSIEGVMDCFLFYDPNDVSRGIISGHTIQHN